MRVQVAATLVTHAATGFATWMAAKLDDEPVIAAGGVLPPPAWATALPETGILEARPPPHHCGAPARAKPRRGMRRFREHTLVRDPQVKVMRTACLPSAEAAAQPGAVLSPVLERVVRRQLASPVSSDRVRAALITCLTNVTGVTALQAAALVAHIEYTGCKVVRFAPWTC